MNERRKNPYVRQDVHDGVLVIFFTERVDGADPDATYSEDLANFERRMADLDTCDEALVAVVDFTNYSITAYDNGRAVASAVLATHRRLKAKGGGLFVCNHPAQFNPDLQHLFHCDKVIGIYRSRDEAMEAASIQMLGEEV